MTDINCSENCVHVKDGKCTFHNVSSISSISITGSGCAYFNPKLNKYKTPLKS